MPHGRSGSGSSLQLGFWRLRQQETGQCGLSEAKRSEKGIHVEVQGLET